MKPRQSKLVTDLHLLLLLLLHHTRDCISHPEIPNGHG
jgi:hypothetical protein